MKTKILFISCFMLAASCLFAHKKKQALPFPYVLPQEKPYKIDSYIDCLREYVIDFTPIEGFSRSKIDVKEVRYVFRHTIPSKAYLAFRSKDKQCLVAYSEPYDGILAAGKYFETPQTTRAQAKAAFVRSTYARDLQLAYGAEAKINDYLTVISGEKAEERFNADSVYVYEITLNHKYLKPYTHSVCMMTMRFPGIYLGIYLFLTDQGYKDMDKYLSKIDRSIFFGNTPKDPYGDLYETHESIHRIRH